MRVRLPDGSFLNELEHAAYDPAKAHKYYMDHRRLHPRQKSTTYTVTSASGTVKLSPQQLEKQRAYAAQRVTQISARISRLTAKLHEKLRAAQQAEAQSKKKPTAADKSKQARESKQYRQKHQAELKNKSHGSSTKSAPKQHTDTVESLKGDIAAAKTKLKDAVARQRSLATATRNG